MQPVFTTFRGGFGDCWGAANYFLRMSERTRRPTRIWNLDRRIRSIVNVLRTTGSIEEVDAAPDTIIFCYWRDTNVHRFLAKHGRLPGQIRPWRMVFAEQYLEAHQTWQPNENRLVTYQLVPRMAAGPSACPAGHVELFLDRMEKMGFELAPLGGHLSIKECIALAAKSRYFVGVDSGMSHLCHSVGVPVHLIRNGLPGPYMAGVTHRGKPFIEYADVPAFLEWSAKAASTTGAS